MASLLTLAGISRNTTNATPFSEKDGLSMCAAYSWRSAFRFTPRDDILPVSPIRGESIGPLDASIFLSVMHRLKLGAQGVNLLDETCNALTADYGTAWFASGRLGNTVRAVADNAVLPDLRGVGNGITATGIDRKAQEDARRIAFAPGAKLTLTGPESSAGWRITYQVTERPKAAVTVSAGGDALDMTRRRAVAAGKGCARWC